MLQKTRVPGHRGAKLRCVWAHQNVFPLTRSSHSSGPGVGAAPLLALAAGAASCVDYITNLRVSLMGALTTTFFNVLLATLATLA
jgi:hypothetical protein